MLITGETGVGKEVVARAIHRLSLRSEKAFVTLDCGTLVESLFESEVFGHVKGAFSGAVESTVGKIELADGGTLFIAVPPLRDRVEDIPALVDGSPVPCSGCEECFSLCTGGWVVASRT